MSPLAATNRATMPTTNPTTKSVPTQALRFKISAKGEQTVCEFASNGDGAKTAPVKITARSGDPIEHWYWGNVVHDLAGMIVEKPKLPLDYCHDSDQILGYANKFDITSGDLVVSGTVISRSPEDRAAEIMDLQTQGVPYEASINFSGDGITVEYIATGQVTTVNGRQFEGPGTIIRTWPLRGIAICPYGADSNTCTEFKDSDSPTSLVTFLSQQEIPPMPNGNPSKTNETTPATEAPKSAVELTEKKPAEGAAPVEAKTPASAYIAAFGDVGARWFVEGKAFEIATTEFVASLNTKHDEAVTALNASHTQEVEALRTKVTELTTRLEATKLGNEPVKFQDAEHDGKSKDKPASNPNELSAKVGDNVAKIAAAIKMPGQAEAAK